MWFTDRSPCYLRKNVSIASVINLVSVDQPSFISSHLILSRSRTYSPLRFPTLKPTAASSNGSPQKTTAASLWRPTLSNVWTPNLADGCRFARRKHPKLTSQASTRAKITCSESRRSTLRERASLLLQRRLRPRRILMVSLIRSILA